jgi:hypothetical protein
VEYPQSLIFDVHLKQRTPSPSPVAPRPKMDFEDRLMQMEKLF